MKIVVTGATGLLGNATAKHLIAKGHEVVPVDRRDGEVAPGIKVIVGDLASLDFCDSVMVGAEAVIHLAAIPNPTDKRQHEVFSNNVVSSLQSLALQHMQEFASSLMPQVFLLMVFRILKAGPHPSMCR